MKRIYLPLVAMSFLISCSDSGWSADEEKTFMGQCVSSAEKRSNNELARNYCDCMLQKLKKSYSSYEKANLSLTTDKDKMQKMALDCKPKDPDPR